MMRLDILIVSYNSITLYKSIKLKKAGKAVVNEQRVMVNKQW